MSINKYEARIAELESMLTGAYDERDEARKLANDVTERDTQEIAALTLERDGAQRDALYWAVQARRGTRDDQRDTHGIATERIATLKSERDDAQRDVRALKSAAGIAAGMIATLKSERDEMRRMMTQVEMECDEDARHLRADKRALKIERDAFALVIARAQVD